MPAQPRTIASQRSSATARGDLRAQQVDRPRARLLQRQHRHLGRAHAAAAPLEPVLLHQMLERRRRAPERRDDREAAGDHAGHVHGGLGDAQHRPARDAAGGVDPGVVEAGDDVAREPLSLALAHLVDQPGTANASS